MVTFADASFYIAWLDAKDPWHEAARGLRELVQRDAPLRTHALAVGEVVAVVGSRRGGKAARQVYDVLRDTASIHLPTMEELDDAMVTVVHHDGTLSLSDALFLVLARKEGADDAAILSFDQDFDRTALTRIPRPA